MNSYAHKSEINEEYPLPEQQNLRRHRRFKSDQARRDALHNAKAARFRAGQRAHQRTCPSTTHMIIDIPCGNAQIPAYVPLHYHDLHQYPVYFSDSPINSEEDKEECRMINEELLKRHILPSHAYAIIEISYGDAQSLVYAPQYFQDSKHYPVYFNNNPINPEEDREETSEVYEELWGYQELYGFGEWNGNVYVIED
jgi:hypothetical protein